jgi:ABC-type glycerol-3-phosphate transport system substrate-binding protein
MRSFVMMTLAVTLGTAAIGGAQAQSADTRIAAMPFAECLSIISEAAQEMDEEPVKLVNTSDIVTARIQASDGFVTVSCDRSDNKITLTKSPVPEAAGMTAAR